MSAASPPFVSPVEAAGLRMPGVNMPTVIHEVTLDDIDQALRYARATRTARKSVGLDTASTDEWIDTLLDMRANLTS